MTPVTLEEDIVDENLLNSEEYRKIVYNTLIPQIKKQCELNRTFLYVNCIFSCTMINFLKKKGFNVMIITSNGNIQSRIEW